jgi:hypothetical protein
MWKYPGEPPSLLCLDLLFYFNPLLETIEHFMGLYNT